MMLGREGEKAYRDAYDLVQRREASAPNEIWQADHTPLDLVARRDNVRREGRPWLTIITDEYGRAVAGFSFSSDRKDYCDATAETWVWSIARVLRPLLSVMANGERRMLEPGVFIASTTARFYSPNEDTPFKCVWLR